MCSIVYLGIIICHGSIKVKVEPDVPERLFALMGEYAVLTTVLRSIELSEENFKLLKLFLSGICREKSIRTCSTMCDVVDILEENLKIHMFNIDTLHAYCKHFTISTVNTCVEHYKEQLKTFLSNTSVLGFKSSLLTKVPDVSYLESVTLKLKDSVVVNEDTLESLKHLAYYCFGNSSKALILCKISQGCVCVTWLAPTSLVSTLKAAVQQHSQKYLSSIGVLEVVIGLRIVPNEGLYFS